MYFIFVIVMYISCHSFPIKGTPLGEIDTLLVLRLTVLVHIVIVIIIIIIIIIIMLYYYYYVQQVFA